MRQGFHPIFKIHGVRDGEMSTYPIGDWVENIDKGKAKPGYQQQVWEHEFPMVDVTGDAAVVKVELIQVKDGKKHARLYRLSVAASFQRRLEDHRQGVPPSLTVETRPGF